MKIYNPKSKILTVDPQKRHRLIHRRNAAKRQRQFDQILATRSALFQYFKAAAIPYKVVYPTTPNDLHHPSQCVDWLTQHFSFHSYGLIDWTPATHTQSQPADAFTDSPSITTLIHNWIAHHHLGNPDVIIVAANAHVPDFKLRLSHAADHAGEIFSQEFWDTWLFDPDADWCIEYFHEGRLTFGRSHLMSKAPNPRQD